MSTYIMRIYKNKDDKIIARFIYGMSEEKIRKDIQHGFHTHCIYFEKICTQILNSLGLTNLIDHCENVKIGSSLKILLSFINKAFIINDKLVSPSYSENDYYYYMVKRGDTISKILKSHFISDTSLNREYLTMFNLLNINDDKITCGKIIKIPCYWNKISYHNPKEPNYYNSNPYPEVNNMDVIVINNSNEIHNLDKSVLTEGRVIVCEHPKPSSCYVYKNGNFIRLSI